MTTIRSFLPKNCTLINALTCCANLTCNKKAEPFTLKMCTACRSSNYCDVDCQKAHRKHHKHQCQQDAHAIREAMKDILLATKYHHKKEKNDDSDCDDDDDDELFQPIPPEDDCPICTLPLPIDECASIYMACCGNSICGGCFQENVRATRERGLDPCCAFCREPGPSSDEECVILLKKRMEMNDIFAINMASQWYRFGKHGLPEDPQMAFDLCLRAAKMGNSAAGSRAAMHYKDGKIVPTDMAKAADYLQKAVKKGNIIARHIIGADKWNKCNYRLGSRHWLLAAAAGCTDSLKQIATCYKLKLVTKKEYSVALASYGNVHKDEWSIERERRAAARK